MPYSKPFLRYVCSGTLFTSEQWSYSMAFVNKDDATPGTPPATVPMSIVNATNIFFTSTGLISQNVSLDTIKLNQIGTDGKYTEADTVQYDFSPVTKGASSTGTAPQVALAITLDTGLRRGRASRGRFYLPTPGYQASPTGGLSNSQQNAVLASVTTYLTALNAAMVGYRLGVVSDLGSGTQHYVTNARVGQVLDTIRSRRRSIPENYVTSTTIPVP